VKNPKQNMHELEKHPKLRNEMVRILQKTKQACQPLSIGIMQPIFKGTIQSTTPKLIRPRCGGFIITK
jgi:hypothetical protein